MQGLNSSIFIHLFKNDRALRQSVATVGFIDDYCLLYRSVFEDVRLYECFKFLHVGIVSPLPRKTLPEIAVEMIREVQAMGFVIERVLADRLYGESGDDIGVLHQLKLPYIVAIRSNQD
jgi:SRSO17 transposase